MKKNPTLISLVILMVIEFPKLSSAKDCPKDQVLLNNECRNMVNYHGKCISSRMCRTKNAICLDENNKIHNFNSDTLDIEREAYCQCPFRYEFNHQKDECVFFRKFCIDDSTCEKNYICRDGQCRCTYEESKEKYYTHCLHQEINVVTCFKDPIRTICTNQTQRYDLPDAFMINNQTWSTMMWKLSFLTVFLILLMLLIKGVLRARQNEDYIHWARQIEAIRNENVHRSNREITVSIQASEQPPPYSEAIKMNNQSERQTQTSI